MIRLFSYFGSKIRASGRYPAPRYDIIVEPFAGAAGYSCRYADHRVILIERDPIIASVLSYLVRVTPDEIMSLPVDFHGKTINDFDLTREQRWMIGLWLNNGAAGPRVTPSKWLRAQYDNIPSNLWGPRCRDRLADTVAKIKHWTVVHASWRVAYLLKLDGPATWFIDPPYVGQGFYYKYHDVNYAGLARFCRWCPGQVIACENEGASWLPFEPLYGMKGTRKDGNSRKVSAECVWLNEEASNAV